MGMAVGACVATVPLGWTRAQVRGHSMAPTLQPGDRVLVRRGRRGKRGDMILFRAPGGREVVKRLVGIPGDVAAAGPTPVRLGAGEVAVAGDNPGSSTDSRSWGPGPLGAVRGRVVGIYHPPDRRMRW